MPKRLTHQEFLDKLTPEQKEKYSYEKALYTGARGRIEIFCKKHQYYFTQTAANHLKGQECPLCDNDARRTPLYGVGINDMPMPSKKATAYSLWCKILERCYSKRYQSKEPTYIGCYICEEWKRLSVFQEWYNENYIEGYQIDKDILVKGNKVYSPDTCCFVPKEINYLLLNRKLHRGNEPLGVEKRRNRYYAYCNTYGKRVHLGAFNSPEDAFNAYKAFKEQHVKVLAEKYYKEGRITERVYRALLDYRVEITD